MNDEDLEKLLGDPSFLRALPKAARLKPRTKKTKPVEAPPEPEKPKGNSLRAKGISAYTGRPIEHKKAAHPNVWKAGRPPEVIERMKLGGLKGVMIRKMKGITRAGVPTGFTKEQAQAAWAKSNKEAKIIVENMVKEGLTSDDEKGNMALEFAAAVVRNDTLPLREKLGAAKLLLEYCKAKPAAKQEVSLTRAEDFLSALLVPKSE